jgi:hypothetical protein
LLSTVKQNQPPLPAIASNDRPREMISSRFNGVVRSGSWLLQNPLLDGYSATEAYLPCKKIAIAVAVTFALEAFESQGNYPNASDTVFRSIGTYLAADDAAPPVPGKG